MMECDITGPHIQSFNYIVDEGIQRAAEDIFPERFKLPNDEAVAIRIINASLGFPTLGGGGDQNKKVHEVRRLYPTECRQRGITYRGKLSVTIRVEVDGRPLEDMIRDVGEVPVMLMSKRCYLSDMSEKELMRRGEEPSEKGGYFVVNGTEKVIRYLVLMRRNYPTGLIRPNYVKRGKLFTEFAVLTRCVRDNHTPNLMTMHYLESGGITLAFSFRRESIFVPLIYVLKALVNTTDQAIYNALVKGREKDDFWKDCVLNMLHNALESDVRGHHHALHCLGSRFRVLLADRVAPWDTEQEVGATLLKLCVCIHLDSNQEKFNFLVYTAQKLIALVKGECTPESPDNPQFQEALLSGHLLLQLLKDKLEGLLSRMKRTLEQTVQRKGKQFILTSQVVSQACASSIGHDISRALEYFLATGNLATKTGLALAQDTGYSVIAERINYLRFVSHFRAIHRGSFFQEMRTTDVRKLKPEAWGFICPVHTPDGAPCGLLNHLTAACRVAAYPAETRELIVFLGEQGLRQVDSCLMDADSDEEYFYRVFMDGRFLGYIEERRVYKVAESLRLMKVDAEDSRVPVALEICVIPRSPDPDVIQTQYPGLYLFSEAGRLIRPVRNLLANRVEFIGTFEQVYMSICIEPEEVEEGVTKHQELAPNAILSFAANLIPLPDHNQSPRNVYQCQMGKQTMGVPVHAWGNRADNKMYRIHSPQSPLMKPEAYDKHNMDEYPLGTNAIVAVISYTGYDMEDAMCINKTSFERGFAHGSVYKCEKLDLRTGFGKTKQAEVFARDPSKSHLVKFMDADGLPIVGKLYSEGQPYCCVLNMDTCEYRVKIYKSSEDATAQKVRAIGSDTGSEPLNHAAVIWRIKRNPIIGDKFASRHGQKGILSFLWPAENMPFTESGMVPDIIFNPHGFPSRMTIGMMIETMGAKGAALHGWKLDATPFVFDEKTPAIDFYGKMLEKAGYNYYGNETLYSGVDGRSFEADIFIGVVYYQRLRHMIADKYQVRATGPVDALTHQPIKGRKRAGGIRLGEMERDGFIAHGTSFLLQDRLFNCSDKDLGYLCTRCNSLIAVESVMGENGKSTGRFWCKMCQRQDTIQMIFIPFVFRYLTSELASMNVKTEINLAVIKPP